jgi:hypothetical protein
MLRLLPAVLAKPDAFRRYWQEQDEHLTESEELMDRGQVVIEEEPELDLAIVRISEELRPRTVWRYLRRERAAVHPFAIHNATRCARLMRIQGRQSELQYRYESWLQIVSRRPAPRVDLAPFCRWLNQHERGGGWIWENTLDIAPRLHFAGRGAPQLTPARFLQRLRHYLRRLPTAWDAYNWRGG